MTDGGALPIAISDLVWKLRERGLIDATVTCGHAFGGDHEAVSVPGALAVARHVGARRRRRRRDGPGRRGHPRPGSGSARIEVGPVLDTADRDERVRDRGRCGSRSPIRGRATAACRTTASPSLTVATRSRVRVAVPTRRRRRGTPDPRRSRRRRHRRPPRPRRRRAGRRRSTCSRARDLQVESMGRPAADDPVLFEAAAAAGTVLAAHDRRLDAPA